MGRVIAANISPGDFLIVERVGGGTQRMTHADVREKLSGGMRFSHLIHFMAGEKCVVKPEIADA